ncbi:MAG: phytoene desaturase family protein [Armatimonadetes bacterium]|nr:phytoene desaturase family protein [Armatimonadota bacterium]
MAHVVVVGGGVGGLAAAARLAQSGYRVTLLEQRAQLGGRVSELRRDGFRFDTGPTLLMMLDPLEKLFRDLHRRLEDYLQPVLLTPSYRVFYADATRFDSSPCIAHMVREIAHKISPAEVPGYLRLMADLSAMLHEVVPAFVRRNYRSPLDLLGGRQIALLVKHRLLANLYRRIRRYASDPRLQMLFTFQTMYLGLSPLEAPWVYGILTYMESGEGVWFPRGGMYQLVRALERVAQEEGVQIRTGERVEQVLMEGNRAKGVRLASGEEVRADVVVLNTDVPTAYAKLLPPTRQQQRRWRNSCSALVFCIGYEGQMPALLHHNVHFCADFERNLREIFVQKMVPEEPSFYTCLSVRTEPSDAPEGCENLYVLVPVPNRSGEDAHAVADEVLEKVLYRLEREAGLQRERVRFVERITPADWEAMGLWQGAAFGLSHDFFQSTCFRPSNRAPFEGVYFVGASTVPGNGIPMVLISAELVQQRICEEVGLPRGKG